MVMEPEVDWKKKMSEEDCMASGGHVLQTKYFRRVNGGTIAIVATVVASLWKSKPIVCDRCRKKLDSEELTDVWERRREGMHGRGLKGKGRRGRHSRCGTDWNGAYQRRNGSRSNEQYYHGRRGGYEGRPRCGRRNSF